MHFFALDVEIANPDLSSICQIGIVEFLNGQIITKHNFLINPEDYFDATNTSIHGITEEMVINRPNFSDISRELFDIIAGKVIVTHTHYDKTAMARVADKYQTPLPNIKWLDSAKVARRTWAAVAYKGYGLANLAQMHEIDFKHHDAVEDARATGLILIKALEETNLTLDEWLIKTTRGINTTAPKRINFTGNADGDLSGETLVFTGALEMPRKQAAALAANCGCDVRDTVNKETTILVVGDQDIKYLAGHNRSQKHRKAEALIGLGANIRIIGESDFFKLINGI